MSRSWTDCMAPQDWHDADYRDLLGRFKKVDWYEKLGFSIDDFPPPLRIMVCQCFATSYPAAIFWGQAMVQIYNAGFAATVAKDMHPDLMGQAWWTSWSDKFPLAESHYKNLTDVMYTGKPMLSQNDGHFIQRGDELEEVYYHYNVSPIRDGDIKPLGLFAVFTESTTTYIAKRRQKVIAEVQVARASAYSATEIFQAVANAVKKEPSDFPCLICFHCNEPLVESSNRTYSRVLCVGASSTDVPTLLRTQDATTWRKRVHIVRDLEDYLLEVLHTLRAVKVTDPDVISKFCERRSHGEQTKTVWLTPIFCFDQTMPAGISIQGLNTRRPQSDDTVVQQIAIEIQASITSASHRASLTEALKTRTAELAVSQKRFEIMAKACPAGIYIINMTSGEFEFVNDAYFDITGIPKEVGISRWSEYVHPDVLEDAMTAWSNLVDEPITNYETRWITPWRGDNERWTSSSAIVHKDESGSSYIFGAFSDASALRYSLKVEKERADSAVKTKQQQLEFLDMIAHELRNPLGAIMQSSDFLIEKLTEGIEGKNGMQPHVVKKEDVEDLQTIVLCSQHMSRIINDTLNLSKLEGGMLIATYVPTQPLAVLKSILAMFDAEAKRSGTDLALEIDQSFIDMKIDWVQTDPSRFSQIVINLLANSIKFVGRMKVRRVKVTLAASSTPMETRVTLDRRPSFVHHSSSNASYHLISPSQEEMPIYIVCRISDTGPGMSEDQVSSLFQRYFQASPKTHVEYGGSGLGLFISKQLVTLLNGSIDVESTKDQGTTFSFSIKSTQCQPPQLATEDTEVTIEGHNHIGSTRNAILIAEDNLINQKIMIKQLSNAGYKTLVANNGREAIELLLEDQKNGSEIALCLCDVEMPVLGGLETIKEVRSLEDSGVLRERCPFIAVTANARQEQITEMLTAGMDDSMPKPFRFDALKVKMQDLLRRLGKAPLVPQKQSALGTVSEKEEARSLLIEPSKVSSLSPTAVPPSVMLRHRRISDLWSDDLSVTPDTFHVILLNTDPPRDIAAQIWTRASQQSRVLKVCADGATDRLHSQLFKCTLESLEQSLQPDVVIGDLDSITAATKHYYENVSGTKVLQVDDQNSTDFTKAIKYIDSQSDDLDIVVIGGVGGRLDQTFSTLNTLIRFPDRRIYILDQDNVIILLCTGRHEIDCTGLGRHCGLVPLCGPVKCWSTGFQWCLNGETMDIGGLISTNNRVVSEDHMISVTCEAPVLFSIEIRQT